MRTRCVHGNTRYDTLCRLALSPRRSLVQYDGEYFNGLFEGYGKMISRGGRSV
jgi:hypothetical protein